MSIKINIPSYLQFLTNNREAVEVNGSTVGECLRELTRQFPDVKKMLFNKNGELHNHLLNYVAVSVNGEDVYAGELAKPVKDGDELNIIYIISGG